MFVAIGWLDGGFLHGRVVHESLCSSSVVLLLQRRLEMELV